MKNFVKLCLNPNGIFIKLSLDPIDIRLDCNDFCLKPLLLCLILSPTDAVISVLATIISILTISIFVLSSNLTALISVLTSNLNVRSSVLTAVISVCISARVCSILLIVSSMPSGALLFLLRKIRLCSGDS